MISASASGGEATSSKGHRDGAAAALGGLTLPLATRGEEVAAIRVLAAGLGGHFKQASCTSALLSSVALRRSLDSQRPGDLVQARVHRGVEVVPGRRIAAGGVPQTGDLETQ